METIEIGMLRVRPDIVRRLIQQLKTELTDVQRIGVYRRNGVEAFADPETLGEVSIKQASIPKVMQQLLLAVKNNFRSSPAAIIR
jgi:hypothetical protein